MSDSFADLWASTAPTKSTPQQPQKIGSTIPPRRQQYDAFSILSASQPYSRPVTNSQPNDQQGRQPQPTSRGGDAFSGLFTSSLEGSPASRNSDRVNMTMAERAVLAQKPQAAQNNAASSSLWDGLDALARPTTTSPRRSASIQGNTITQDSFDFGFHSVPADKAVPSTVSPPNNASIENDDWGLDEFSSPTPSESRSAPPPTKPVSGSKSMTLWDLDEFGSSEPQASQPQPQVPARSLTGTPGDFDFGDREDRLLGGDNSDAEDTFGIRNSRSDHPEGDILGDLGKPLPHSRSLSPNPSTSPHGPVSPRAIASPPPHITGQLVEMGFSPVDACAALANTMTENGFDVQAATELLLSQADQEGSIRSSPHPPERERRTNGARDRDRDRTGRPTPPTRTDLHTQPSNPTQSPPQLDVTAEKLLSQASEIGRGMFSKANALWKEGKERAVKIYEERAATANTASGVPVSDGRPRWMRDRDHTGGEWQQPDQSAGRNVGQAVFKDDDEEGQGREQRERQRPPARRPAQSQLPSQSQPPPPSDHEREVDLFGSDSPRIAYQSPFRRGKPKPQAPPSSIQSSLSAPMLSTRSSTSSGPSTSQRPPQPPRTFTTTIALSALVTSTSHKSAGTDAYKRGDFPVALAAYMRALSALPQEHILRLPILTNVALVQSKVGELKDTIKACEEAVMIIRRFVDGASGDGRGGEVVGMSFALAEPDFDEKMPVEVGSGKVNVSVQGGGGATSNGDLPTSVDLVEGLSKAFRRRAEALEGLEKWKAARSTWEVLLGAEWAGTGLKGEAMKGVGRCRRMVDGGGAGLSSQSAPPKPIPKPKSTPHPRPKPTPASSASPPPSAALTAFRSTNDAQQTEDAARLACKDAVDARLAGWKSGREGNIRALLTSLDETVLWPELGWRKVGMAEVVSKGQLKGAYVRAIAKVHPDKLNGGNTTVEQRMIANGVFGSLNEAWNLFQQQPQ